MVRCGPPLDALVRGLQEVNEALWEIENGIRACEVRGDFGPRFVELAARSTGATTAARRSSAASMRRRARRSSRRNCIARTRALRKATDNVRDLENHSGFQHPRQMGVPVQQQSVGRQAQLRIGPSSRASQRKSANRGRMSEIGGQMSDSPPHAAAFPKAEGRRAPEALNRTQRIPDSVTHIRQTSCGAIANRRVNGLPISSVLKGRETAIEQQVGRDLPKVVLDNLDIAPGVANRGQMT